MYFIERCFLITPKKIDRFIAASLFNLILSRIFKQNLHIHRVSIQFYRFFRKAIVIPFHNDIAVFFIKFYGMADALSLFTCDKG